MRKKKSPLEKALENLEAAAKLDQQNMERLKALIAKTIPVTPCDTCPFQSKCPTACQVGGFCPKSRSNTPAIWDIEDNEPYGHIYSKKLPTGFFLVCLT